MRTGLLSAPPAGGGNLYPGMQAGSDMNAGMRYVEGGEFRMGSDHFYPEDSAGAQRARRWILDR